MLGLNIHFSTKTTTCLFLITFKIFLDYPLDQNCKDFLQVIFIPWVYLIPLKIIQRNDFSYHPDTTYGGWSRRHRLRTSSSSSSSSTPCFSCSSLRAPPFSTWTSSGENLKSNTQYFDICSLANVLWRKSTCLNFLSTATSTYSSRFSSQLNVSLNSLLLGQRWF